MMSTLAGQAVVLDRPATGLPHDAGAVRIVDDENRAVPLRQLHDLGQLREIALHREDAVGRDDDRERALHGLQLCFEVGHVAVLVTLAARFARRGGCRR